MVNKRKRQERINRTLRLVDSAYKLIKNSVVPQVANSPEHEVKKFQVCYELVKEGKEVYTEVRFSGNKGRCDILIPEDNSVIEILFHETMEEAKEKVKKYPKTLNINFVPAEPKIIL